MINESLTFDDKHFLENKDFKDPNKLFDFLKHVGKFSSKSITFDVAYIFSSVLVAKNEAANINRIIEAMPYKAENFDIVDLKNSMAHLGYITNTVDNISLFKIDERLLPCVFVRKFENQPQTSETYTVLKLNTSKTEALVYSSSERKNISIPFSENYVGSAFFFDKYNEKDDVLSKYNRDLSNTNWFKALLYRFKWHFLFILGLSVALALISLSVPVYILITYDLVIQPQSTSSLFVLFLGVAFALVIDFGLRFTRCRTLTWIGARLDNLVCNAIFNHLLKLPAIYIEGAPVSSQVSRIRSFEAIRDFFSGSLFVTMAELPYVLILLLALAFISPYIVIIPIAFMVVYILFFVFTRKLVRIALVNAATASADKQKMQLETFEKIDSIKYNGMADIWLTQYREKSGRSSLLNFKAAFFGSVMTIAAQSISTIAGIVTLYVGVELIWANHLTPGGLIAGMILVWRSLSSFQSMVSMLPRFEQVAYSIGQVNRLMDIQTEIGKEQYSITQFSRFKGDITFAKVGLRYKKENDPVFAGLSFDIHAGDLVMITGPNGSGKSTILKLMNGLYYPQAGNIRIDGIDVRQIDLKLLRHNIAYVTQTPEFFFGTIAQNLRLAEPLALDDELYEALEKADALNEVKSLSHGIKTIIYKDHSSRLSTSLGFKLNLARAYISKAPIYLIDELPYALLNSKTGENLKKTLAAWKGKKTIIMITHRNDYLMMADTGILLTMGERPIVGKPSDIINHITKSR